MANQEACELWIEQEVVEGLAAGKKPYVIGKEVSGWVAKLFDAKIKTKTLAQRAYRMRDKNSTNVEKEQTQEKTDTSEDLKKLEKPEEYTHGGKREGAGRPELKHTETHEVTYAMDTAAAVVSQLEGIKEDDPHRREAFLKVGEWVYNNIDK